MKSKLAAISLLSLTAGVVGVYPLYQQSVASTPVQTDVVQQKAKKIELVFALDTTGSMSGLIDAAKEKIWSIATNMAQAQSSPEIRIGLVAFRDRGDAYVTRVINLSSDLDSVYSQLMDFQANGGGDGPESVNQALYDAVHKISWSKDQSTYKAIFLVGDAPPHMDYQDDVKYPVTLAKASVKGILVNTIQCGKNSSTTAQWKQIASLGQGNYFDVAQNGSAVAVATPFDRELATLAHELDDTRLYYGTREELARKKAKIDATEKLHDKSSVESQARRAMFNASESGKKNQIGDGDLVEDVSSGRVQLESIDKAKLPAAIAAKPAEEQQKLIDETAEKRQVLKKQIKELAGKRDAYIRQKLEASGGAKGSLDEKLVGTLRAQAAGKGLEFEEKPVTY